MNHFVLGGQKLPGSALLLTLLTGLLGACASAPPKPSRFPSPEALAELSAQPVHERGEALPVESVDEWKLTGPFPDAGAPPARLVSPSVERLLSQAANTRAGTTVLASAAAACTARELALFRAAHAGLPSEALLRFMAGRCGLTTPEVTTACKRVPAAAAPDADDDRVVEQNAPVLQAAMGETLTRVAAAQMEAGLAMNRGQTDTLFCWVVAPRVAVGAPVALGPDGNGMITVEVTLPEETTRVEALVTVGQLGVRACTARDDVELPRISLACPVDRSDTAAWIDISATQADRADSQRVFSGLVWPAGVPGDTYGRTGASLAGGPLACEPAGAAPAGDAVGLCLNQLRKARKLSPLTLAIGQSRAAEPLARHLFAGLSGATAATGREQAELGLRAGWSVKADVRADVLFGQLAYATHAGAPEPAALLEALLERPLERAALLDPQAGAMAVAVVPAGGGTTGVAVSTYRVIREGARNQDADVRDALEHLNARRAAIHLNAATIFENAQWGTQQSAQKVTQGIWTTRRATEELCSSAAARVKFSHIHVWMIESPSPGMMAIPQPLLRMTELELAIGVALGHDDREPWARYQMFFVAVHATRDSWGADSGTVCTSTLMNAGS